MIVNNFSRKPLVEGRNFGFGFGFVNKINAIISGDNIQEARYELMTPISACKDYLNDFVYVEATGLPLESAFGFKHDYTGVLKDKEYFYLAVTSLDYKSGSPWDGKKDLNYQLNNNFKNLIKFINKVEDFFKLDRYTEFEHLENNILILKLPIFWFKFHFLMSLYALYVRCFVNISDKDLQRSLEDLINNREPYLRQDNMLLKSSARWIEFDNLLDYEYPKELLGPMVVHNSGISARVNELIKDKQLKEQENVEVVLG